MSPKKSRVEKSSDEKTVEVQISAPNKKTAIFKIIGTSPYVQNKFSRKAIEEMKSKQIAGSTAKIGKRKPKDFEFCYQEALYKPSKGTWPNGAIKATHIKSAMVGACRNVDFKMTQAKQCVFIEADGYDKDELSPLIKIIKGKPRPFEQALRCANGNPDIRVRPIWDEGWEAIVRVSYDADKFTLEDVTNLLMRAGSDVGIGEGRHASRSCVGQGWGAFKIASGG
jgi:hypothetical protein